MDNYSFDSVKENIRIIFDNIRETKEKYSCTQETQLMAVTKTVPTDVVNWVFGQGVNLLGENRVQEFLSKKDSYDKSTLPEIHFIGHLQTNKVKYIIDDVDMIQSVDSLKLANEINRLALAHNKVMDILCEVNIGSEESKSGISPAEMETLLEQLSTMEGIRVKGLMTIPPPVDSDIHFGNMAELFHKLKDKSIENINMDTLSMGMTHDYANAVKYGSTIVRVGTGIFGKRDYR